MKEVDVRIKGAGSGRESSIRSMAKAGLKILSIEDGSVLKAFNHLLTRTRERVGVSTSNDSDTHVKIAPRQG